MTKQSEHPSYGPLDEPEGSGVETPDTYLYNIQGRRLAVLCPSCARQLRVDSQPVLVLKDSNSGCIACSSNPGRINEW